MFENNLSNVRLLLQQSSERCSLGSHPIPTLVGQVKWNVFTGLLVSSSALEAPWGQVLFTVVFPVPWMYQLSINIC